MANRVELVWRCDALTSVEHFTLRNTDRARVMSGDVALVDEGIPCSARYTVTTSLNWVVEAATADLRIGDRRRVFDVTHRGGVWTVNGEVRADLAGCSDLDLGWTPATNTVPLRRLAAANDCDEFVIQAAWLRFPELDLQANEQRYTRLGPSLWRYQSGPYDFELAVSKDFLVLEYGDDLWRAEAIARYPN